MTDAENEFAELLFKIGAIFTPGSPVNEKDLFAGRIEQIQKVLSAISQRGYHAVIYGERGVGKTSLANILRTMLPAGGGWIVPRVNCDGNDTFSSLWRKAFSEIELTSEKQAAGFSASTTRETQPFTDLLKDNLSPDDVRRALTEVAKAGNTLVVFDEFDRVSDKRVTALMADAIKSLSDYGVNATVLLIGVADSVDEIVEGHHSIERALIQIPMPRMSTDEVKQIVENGIKRLEMSIASAARSELISLSQGLPYITHLLGLHSGSAALESRRASITQADVDTGIRIALDNWQQTTKRAYYEAVQSAQPGNIYKQVLLACALAETDEFGFFSASAVRTPLRAITSKDYDIPNFAQHLKNFSEDSRGSILERTGTTRRIRFRFSSPLLRPYIIMRGLEDKILTRAQMQSMTSAPGK